MITNKPRAIEWMQRCHVDAILATSPVNVFYLSEYWLWIDAVFKQYMVTPGAPAAPMVNYLLLNQDGRSTLILNRFLETNAAASTADDVLTWSKWPSTGACLTMAPTIPSRVSSSRLTGRARSTITLATNRSSHADPAAPEICDVRAMTADTQER
ncbi:MAG: hypothetical protein CMJ18_15400 [Phycisphaeraceae bacterium]|nr:hypothetical protein [Phycisphaeraceae bacterium]